MLHSFSPQHKLAQGPGQVPHRSYERGCHQHVTGIPAVKAGGASEDELHGRTSPGPSDAEQAVVAAFQKRLDDMDHSGLLTELVNFAETKASSQQVQQECLISIVHSFEINACLTNRTENFHRCQ